MPKYPPSRKRLRRAAPHVAHEATRLAEAWRRHGSDRLAWIAWCVHARTLMDFFTDNCPKVVKGKPLDDICAWHFFDTPGVDGKDKWSETRQRWLKKPRRYARYKKAADKLAAHLTFDRIGYEGLAQKNQGYEPSAEITKYHQDLSICSGKNSRRGGEPGFPRYPESRPLPVHVPRAERRSTYPTA